MNIFKILDESKKVIAGIFFIFLGFLTCVFYSSIVFLVFGLFDFILLLVIIIVFGIISAIIINVIEKKNQIKVTCEKIVSLGKNLDFEKNFLKVLIEKKKLGMEDLQETVKKVLIEN